MYSDATTTVAALNFSFYFILWISIILLIGVTAAMIFFVVRYHRSRHPHAENIEGNLWLELTWTVIPTLLVMAMFYYGWVGYIAARRVPENAMVVKVTAQMWSWLFEYPNGKTDTDLYVPVHKPVKLVLVSRDVNHSFFVAPFRIKEDVIPGRENYLWFNANNVTTYDIQCAEYCGTKHSGMLAKLHVLSQADYDQWYTTITPTREVSGERLLQLKGCLACHTLDGARGVGPSLKGLFGSRETVLAAGKEFGVTIDDEYLKESLLNPNAKIVKGYSAGKMPAQEGVLSEEELQRIIDYVKQNQ